MKKKAVIFTLCFFVFGGLFLTFFGNPLTRIQSKQLVAEYLEITYPEKELTIDKVSYYPFEGTYIVHFVSKDGTLQSNIDVKRGKIITSE